MPYQQEQDVEILQQNSILVIGIVICVVIGIPIGIAMSRSERVRNIILPILDTMQVIPAFCYLIPGIILFGLGAIPAIISIRAVVLFSSSLKNF